MSKLRKFLFIALGMLIFLIAFSIKTNAASLTISTSKSQVAPGESFTVTVRLSNGAGSISSTGHGATWLDNSSYSYTMTAGNSNVSISASGVAGDYTTEQNQNVSASCIVKVAAAQPTSTTNPQPTTNPTPSTAKPTLSNLGIKPYDFSGFRAANLSYSVNVPNDCTSVTVYASSANGTVSGTGAITLKEGTNIAKVTVSNANGSQTYTISINRANAEGEEVTNEKEETEEPEENPVIGLSALSIEGYKFNKEFAIDTYEYTVDIEKALTQEELDQIKEKVVATASAENVIVEKTAVLNEDGTAVIKIVVKDEEKQFSEYVIKFELVKKEAPKAVGAIIPRNNDLDGFFTTLNNKVYLILGLGILGYLIAMFMAIHAYSMTRRLNEYEEDEYLDDDEYEEGEEEELKTISQYGKKKADLPAEEENMQPSYFENINDEKEKDDDELTSDVLSAPKDDDLYARYEATKEENDRIHELDEDESSIETAKDAITRASRLGGYRNLRSKKSTGGRHF